MAHFFPEIPLAGTDLTRAKYEAENVSDALIVAFWHESRTDAIDTYSRERAMRAVKAMVEHLGYTLTPIAQTEAAE